MQHTNKTKVYHLTKIFFNYMKNNEMKCIYAAQPMFLCFLICFFTFSCLRNTLQKHPFTCSDVFRYFVLIFADRERIQLLLCCFVPCYTTRACAQYIYDTSTKRRIMVL